MTPHPPEEREPRISIIIPCRDDQAGLDEAIASILAQSEQDFEVIVVDDGSDPPVTTDPDPRIKVLRNSAPRGPAHARNRGIVAARGEIIAFCDSDDVYAPGRLQAIAKAHLESPLVVCRQGTLGATNHARAARFRRSNGRSPLDATTPALGATSVKRGFCLPFDETFLACQDIEWWIRTLSGGLRPVYVDHLGYLFRRSDRPRLLNSHRARLEFSYLLLQVHDEYFATHPRARAFRWLRIAIMERSFGSTSLASAALRHSIRSRFLPAAALEAIRLARAMIRDHFREPEPIGDLPLPPLAPYRGEAFAPSRRGPAESTLRPRSRIASVT